jgi:hypothetical protein
MQRPVGLKSFSISSHIPGILSKKKAAETKIDFTGASSVYTVSRLFIP